MKKYDFVVIDFETTGLDPESNEILQVSIIDNESNVLINKYCKPINLTEWEEAEEIHHITPDKVKNEKPFECYIDRVKEILESANTVVIYNAAFEIEFLKKYNIKINSKIDDLMMDFAIVYNEYSDYWGDYKWQKLSTCANYYGYYLNNAHDSLEDCKATLYCYKKYKNNEGKYEGKEYIGKTVDDFLESIRAIIGDNKVVRIDIGMYDTIKLPICEILGLKINRKALFNCKIESINYYTFRNWHIRTEECVEEEIKLRDKQIEHYLFVADSLRKECIGLSNRLSDNSYELKKLQKENLKLKERLGEAPPKEIEKLNKRYGTYTAEYCRTTKKPMFKNKNEYEPFADKLLSATRCKKIGQPVKENEEIYAFKKVMNGYCPLYFRKGDK